MKRDLAALADNEFDLVVVGGGIFGISAAWDATLRGLSVALVERDDFAHATSANSFKIVHGGIRYLQHLDIPRLRESSRERNALLRVAPHLVEPLPIVVPTYGHGKRGKELLAVGLALYDLLVPDRNRGIEDPDRRVPRGRTISRDDCLALFPNLSPDGLTGAGVFADGQMYNPQRLALSFLRAAVGRGTVAANYVEATRLSLEGDRVVGVEVRDRISGEKFGIRSRVVINAAGPWAEGLLAKSDLGLRPPSTFSRDACLVVRRRWPRAYALAVPGRTRDPDAVFSRETRHLFLVPWRDVTLVGVWHVVHDGDPEDSSVSDRDIAGFLNEINEAYPGLDLTPDEVALANAGLVLFGENEPGARDLSYGKRSRLIDHSKKHGVDGLVTMIGVRYTMARRVAQKGIDLVFGKLGRRPPPCRTGRQPVHGGRIERFGPFVERAVAQRPAHIAESTMRSLARNYGSEYGRVLEYASDAEARRPLGDSHVLGAEVIHAVREEMALRLADVVFRRTDLGTAGHPGESAVEESARIMGRELGWSEDVMQEEIARVRRSFPAAAVADKAVQAQEV